MSNVIPLEERSVENHHGLYRLSTEKTMRALRCFTRILGENGLKCSFPQLEGTVQRGEPAISASHPCFQGMNIIGRGSRSEIKSQNP